MPQPLNNISREWMTLSVTWEKDTSGNRIRDRRVTDAGVNHQQPTQTTKHNTDQVLIRIFRCGNGQNNMQKPDNNWRVPAFTRHISNLNTNSQRRNWPQITFIQITHVMEKE
jgi:hypothetical protein